MSKNDRRDLSHGTAVAEDGAHDTMLMALCAALDKAHCPYSHFPVAAVVQDEQGLLHAGVNIENASYPQGWCAEPSAISAMVMAGGKQIHAVGVLALSAEPCTPCGGCRQKLREFAGAQTPIYVFGPKEPKDKTQPDSLLSRTQAMTYEVDRFERKQIFILSTLLPFSFGPNNLSNMR